MDMKLFQHILGEINKWMKIVFKLLNSVKYVETSQIQKAQLCQTLDVWIDDMLDFKSEVNGFEKKENDKKWE